MTASTGDTTKKKLRTPRPPAPGVPVMVRLQPDDLAALDALIAARPEPKPSRPEAIRIILADWLRTHGFIESEIDARGPATNVVKSMDSAIAEDRAKLRSS